jgi:tRNA pseudouridine55 synthase
MTVSGILNIDKEAGLTSFQVVALVRRGAGARRVGHAGTLDPAATGVLLVCLGQAVRITEYLMALPKTYRARVALGMSTDTYDAEGAVTGTADAAGVSREGVEEALRAFVGDIVQTPPSYSAVKVAGQPAYRRARRGEIVTLSHRPARVHRIALLSFEPPMAEIEVECGKGTYIRSIAHDLGQALGCGAHLASLVRSRVGPFRIEDAVATAELREALDRGTWQELLLPPDYGLTGLPQVTLEMAEEQDVRHGLPVRIAPSRLAPAPECRAYAEDGGLVGILAYDARTGMWRPRKVFGG